MSLTRQDVEKVALLARLSLTNQELDTLTAQMGQIVEYVEQLAELDEEIERDNIQPMAHPLEMSNVFAEDRLEKCLDRAQALANAPKQDGECYRVPAVLGE